MDSRNQYPPEMIQAARAEIERRKKAAQMEIDRRNKDNGFLNSAAKIPGYALGAALKLPGQLIDIVKQVPGSAGKIITNPIDAARDLAGGVARGSQNLASAGLEGGEFITRKGAEALGKLFNNPVNVPKWNAREFMGLEGNNKIDLGKYIESKNPNKLLSGIGQYGLGGASLGTKILPVIAANATNMALQAPPGQRLQAGVEGAVNTALPIGAAKGFNAMRPSRMFAGNLSPEELNGNLEATQGTNTGLGDVIGSPTLKRLYENVLPRVPFTGADVAMQKTAGQLIEQGEGHIAKLGEGLPEGDKTKIFQDALKEAASQASKENVKNYQKVNKIADDQGLIVPRENFRSKAQAILDDIDQSPELKRKMDAGLLSDIREYAKNEKGNNLRLSNIFKGKLNDAATEFYLDGKKYEYGLMRDLKEALGKDIEGSISSSKSEELKEAYDYAQKQHGAHYRQFEDPDITKFTREGGDADLMLSHFLRIGQNDRSNLLSKVTAKLPEKLQSLPSYMYLSRAIDENGLNPLKMRTLYKNLGQKQRELLISDPAMKKALEKYIKAVGMNTEAFNTMFNPKTGQRNLDVVGSALGLGGSSALSPLFGGGITGHVLGGLAGVALPGLAGRAATKLMTSPTVRTSLVKAIIKAKTKQKK